MALLLCHTQIFPLQEATFSEDISELKSPNNKMNRLQFMQTIFPSNTKYSLAKILQEANHLEAYAHNKSNLELVSLLHTVTYMLFNHFF